jgi:hypothetical protein
LTTLIRAVRPWGQSLSDVLITDGKIAAVEIIAFPQAGLLRALP